MTDLTRRTALRGVAAAGVATLAGCAGAGVPGENGDDASGDTGGDDDGSDGEFETAVRQVGEALLRHEWDRTERPGHSVLIADDADAEWLLAAAPEPVRAFVEATDFAASAICYVESVGPTTCHDEIAFDGVAVEDGTLVADATVRGPENDDVVCGEAITYSAALLRITTDPLPDAVRLSVTDGWGETGTVRNGDWVRDDG